MRLCQTLRRTPVRGFRRALLSTALALPLVQLAQAIPLDPTTFEAIGSLTSPSGSVNLNSTDLSVRGILDVPNSPFPRFVSGSGVLQSQVGGPDIAVFTFDDIDLGTGVNVTITGARPVAILSKGNAIFRSALSVSASGAGGGPGGGIGGAGGGIASPAMAGTGPSPGQAGISGGGGGYGGAGGDGAQIPASGVISGFPAGTGGSAYPGDFTTLQGGSGGGGGIALSGATAALAGGGGGGAVQISATGLTHVASVASVGASAHGGGAGSGGMIELRGARVSVGTGGLLDASGGDAMLPGSSIAGLRLPGGGGGGGLIILAPGEFAWDVDQLPAVDVSGGTVPATALGVTPALAGNPGVMHLRPDALAVGAGQAFALTAGPVKVPGSDVTIEFSALRIDAGGLAFAAGAFSLNKSLQMNGGFVTVPGGLTVTPATTLTGFGTVGGPLILPGVTHLVARGGALSVGDLSSPNGVQIEGIVTVREDSTLLIQNAGRATLGQSTVLFTGSRLVSVNGLELSSGVLLSATGAATIEGKFRNQGTVLASATPGEAITFLGDVDGAGRFGNDVVFHAGFNPGNSPAVVHLDNVKFDPTATLTIEIGGLVPGQFDQLVVDGSAHLDGTLQLKFIGGFSAHAGDSFAFLVAGSRVGTFAHVNVTGLDPALRYAIGYGPDGVRFDVQAVPEPQTWALIALGLGGVLLRVVANV